MLTTLELDKTPTVRDVHRLFKGDDYRDRLLDRLDDELSWEFWEDFETLSLGQQEQIAYPVLYRMRKFYGNKTLYPIMCHPQTLDLGRFIAERKIVLVSLQADRRKIAPAEQRLLGIILVLQLQLAAMSSLSNPMFYLYIDEAQNFVTTALDTILSEARKFRLSLTLANQFFQI